MYDIQVVIRFAELAAFQQHLRDFLHRDVVVSLVQPAVKGTASDNQVLALLHGVLDGVQIGAVQVAGRHKEVAVLVAYRLFPEQVSVRLIAESLVQGNGSRQHIGIVVLVDNIFVKGVFVDEGRRDLIEAIPAAALPILRFCDAAGVLTRNHLVRTHLAVGVGVVAHFHTDPAPTHFLCYGSSRAGTEERIENKVAGVGCNVDDAFNQSFRLGRVKRNITAK